MQHKRSQICTSCGPPERDGFQQGEDFFCDNCWTCMLCGNYLPQITKVEGESNGRYCKQCFIKACKFNKEEEELLHEIDQLRAPFSIWEGRGYQTKCCPPVQQPAEVADKLFLGDLDDAQDGSRLRALGIGAVLNLCPDDTRNDDLQQRLEVMAIRCKSLRAYDKQGFQIVAKILPDACTFIDEEMREGHGVLVHCLKGINRSAAVVVGYLVLRKKKSLVATIRHVMTVRGTVLTNRSFRWQLVRASLGLDEQMDNSTATRQEPPKLVIPFCCKRRRVDIQGSVKTGGKRLRKVGGGVGNLVHGLCFELEDGTRSGCVLDNDKNNIDLQDTHALEERQVEWRELEHDEFVTAISGHRSQPGLFLASEIIIHTSFQEKIIFRGNQFERHCRAPFQCTASAGYEIVGVHEDFFELQTLSHARIMYARTPRAEAFRPPISQRQHTASAIGKGKVRRVAVGVGHVVHGLIFELSDGTRNGCLLEDQWHQNNRHRVSSDIYNEERVRARNVVWRDLDPNEYIVRVSGHKSSWNRLYLAANVVLLTNLGNHIVFQADDLHFHKYCRSPFEFTAHVGYEIVELQFDLEQGTCSGIQESPILQNEQGQCE